MPPVSAGLPLAVAEIICLRCRIAPVLSSGTEHGLRLAVASGVPNVLMQDVIVSNPAPGDVVVCLREMHWDAAGQIERRDEERSDRAAWHVLSRVAEVADLARPAGVRIVCVAGPVWSGHAVRDRRRVRDGSRPRIPLAVMSEARLHRTYADLELAIGRAHGSRAAYLGRWVQRLEREFARRAAGPECDWTIVLGGMTGEPALRWPDEAPPAVTFSGTPGPNSRQASAL